MQPNTRAAVVRRACSLSRPRSSARETVGGSGSSPGSSSLPPTSGTAKVRFIDGAPSFETIIASTPQSICSPSSPCYLHVNGNTVTQLFSYGSMTPFVNVTAGTLSLVALDGAGYSVGPLKTTALTGGNRYTLVVVGAYPNYRVLTFEEPKNASGAQLSLYEASPMRPSIDFGSFRASSGTGLEKLGSARFGNVATVSLAKQVSDLGAYAGSGTHPIAGGKLTLVQINGFDTHNELPFHSAGRVSLFLFDPKGNTGPVFGSLDR